MTWVKITSVHVDGFAHLEVREHFEEPGSAVIAVHGELDQLTEGVFDRTLRQAWDLWPDEVIVDLRAATFINARGLASLLRAAHTARVRGLPLTVRCHPGLVARMVSLIGLAEAVAIPAPAPAVPTDPAAPRLTRRSPPAFRFDRPHFQAVQAPHAAVPHLVDRSTQPAATGNGSTGVASSAVAALVDLDRLLAAAGSGLEATLQVVLAQLLEHVAGAEHSSFTRGHLQRLSTATTSSSPGAILLADLQRRSRQGPARDSQRLQEQVYSADLRGDTRWPQLTRLAAGEAMRSLLTLPLVHEGNRLGVLTLHSQEPDAFDEGCRELATALAARAATGLGNADVRDGLQKALLSRDVIGQGKGILMARHGMTADQAFALISERSQRTNTRLVDVAEGLTRTGDL